MEKRQKLFFLIFLLALGSLACVGFSTADIEQLLDLLPTSEPYTDSALDGDPILDCIPANEIEYATVTYIYDGDTIQVEMDGEKYKVRYVGIDTPERDEFYYWEATQANADLLPIGSEIMLVKDVNDTDQYGRLVRYIVIGDIFINYELVLDGYAYAKSYRPDTACDVTLDAAEKIAADQQIGLHQP